MAGSEGGHPPSRGLWLAGAGALCAVLLGLSTNVASSLVPDAWSRRHAAWVWAAVAVLGVASVWLAIIAWRHSGSSLEAGTGDRVQVQHAGPVHVEAIGRGARVDRSIRGSQGPVVIAEAGASVTFQSEDARPSPSAGIGQVVVGELPGAPPALVTRAVLERLAAAFEAGDRVATVSALSGGRGAGKTQVAAQYARQAIADGVELVAWVSGGDHDRLLRGLAEAAHRMGVADPEGDSEKSAHRLRDALAARTAPAVLVIDNASDPRDIRRYIPTTGATRVILTSTELAFGSLGTMIDVGVFDRAQSRAYLAQRTGLTDGEGASDLAEELGDLPLALAQAATVIKLRRLSYQDYLRRLRSLTLDEMLPADRGDPYPHGVARAIMLAIEATQAGDATGLTGRVLGAAAVLSADGVGRDVLAHVVGGQAASFTGLDETVGRLVEGSLLVWAHGTDAVVMHRLVARAIRDHLHRTGDLPRTLAAAGDNLRPLLTSLDQAWHRRHEAVELVGQALALWENAVDASDRGVLIRDNLSDFIGLALWAVHQLQATADISRAIEVGTSVLEACERLLGPDHPDTLTSRNSLAYAYESRGDLGRAISLYEATLAARERVLGHDHPDTVSSRNNLAYAYQWQGDFERAIQLYGATLASCGRVVGLHHPDTLSALSNLAGVYQSMGDLERAVRYYEATLTGSEPVLGHDHPDTLTSRNNLAGAYEAQGDLGRAIPLYEATLAARERVLGHDHPDTLGSRINLAGAYESQGDLARAIQLFEATLPTCEKVLGHDHPDTLTLRNNLAGAYQSRGDVGRAIPLYEATLAARERVLGPATPTRLLRATTSRAPIIRGAISGARSRSTKPR